MKPTPSTLVNVFPTEERIEAMREALHSFDLRLQPALRDEIDAALLALHEIAVQKANTPGRREATTKVAASALMGRLISQFGVTQKTAAAMVLGRRSSPSEITTLAREYRKYKSAGRLQDVHVAPSIHPVLIERLPRKLKAKPKK